MSASWKEHKEGDEGVQRVERRETERGEKVTAGQLSWCFVASKSTGGEEKAFRNTSKVSVCVVRRASDSIRFKREMSRWSRRWSGRQQSGSRT